MRILLLTILLTGCYTVTGTWQKPLDVNNNVIPDDELSCELEASYLDPVSYYAHIEVYTVDCGEEMTDMEVPHNIIVFYRIRAVRTVNYNQYYSEWSDYEYTYEEGEN